LRSQRRQKLRKKTPRILCFSMVIENPGERSIVLRCDSAMKERSWL